MPPSFEPRWSDAGLAIATCDRVAVMIWRGDPTVARIETACAAFEELSRSLGALSLFAIVEADSPPPSPRDLPLVVRGFDAISERLLATVGVLEERVATSAILEAASLVRSLQRAPRPTKFCADVREAATWLAARHPLTTTPTVFQAELLECIEATRARLAVLERS